MDPLTDEGETEKDQSYNEDEDAGRGEGSSDAFEAQSESSTSLISIGDDGEYGDNSDLHEEEGYEDKSEADEEEEDDDDYEEEPPYDYQDDHGDGSEVDGDERYARLLQQQEIALARSYLQDGFLGQELVAAMAAASEDSSIDMSYEALLELEENLGEVKRRGLEEHTLQGLPRQLHGQGSDLVGRGRGGGEGEGVRERARQCAVCLLDYVLGDELVSLPCTHRFHSECAIQWLRQRATCPVCREVVPDAPICIDLS